MSATRSGEAARSAESDSRRARVTEASQTVRRAPETQMSHPSARLAAGAFWAIWTWMSQAAVRVAAGAVWVAGAVVGASWGDLASNSAIQPTRRT